MWRSASESEPVHSRYSQLSQAWRTAKPIRIISAVSNWFRRRTSHELNSLNSIRLMWSTASAPGLTRGNNFHFPSSHFLHKRPFKQAIFVMATQCNLSRTKVATSKWQTCVNQMRFSMQFDTAILQGSWTCLKLEPGLSVQDRSKQTVYCNSNLYFSFAAM